ncbi:outer membrane protein [Vannielia sp. SX4]|uniref:outer membrane protein n=1 Tax=Vannielia sp. SX4 TaxID=3463852 RepID=UPI0040599F0A
MRISLFSTTALVALSTAAASPALATDWDGWFVGAQLGFNQHVATYEDPDYDWYGHTQDFISPGAELGFQAGYNTVSGNRLNGFVIDIRAASNSETKIYASDDNVPNEVDFLATLRGRTGLVVDDTAIYLTAGLAHGKFSRSWTEFNDVDDSWPDLGASKTGLALGFGIEHAINDNWSIGAEYLASIFGENVSINADDFPLRINDTVHTLSFAVNYHLGGGLSGPGKADVVGSPANFSGGYIGGFAGYGIGEPGASDIDYDYYGGTYDVTAAGAFGGLTAGYNWQSGSSVFGIEAQLGFGNMSASYTADGNDFDVSVDSTLSLRGKAGVVAGNTMMYVLGGVTSAQISNTWGPGEYDLDGTYTGLTVGAGIEQLLPNNLSWNLEAAYTRFAGVDDALGEEYTGHADLLQVTAGLNYHFGGSATGSGAAKATHDWSGGFYGVDVALLANKGSVWDQDYYEYGGTYDLTSLGGGLGGHIGMNWQNGSFVYGGIADIAFYSNSETDTSPGYREVTSELKAMATIRGRAGIATGNSLFYATGGLAIANSELSHRYLPGPNTADFDMSDTRIGAVVGLGMEHAMSEKSSIRVEALMTRFAPKSYENGDDCSGPVGFDGGACNMDGWDSNVQIKAGYSWSF